MSFASTIAASVVAKMLNDPTVFREWPHYNQGVEHATLDQGYSLLRSDDLESARGTQAMIQHRGADHGTLEQGASLMTSNRLSSAMASQSRIKEYHGKRPLHPLETTTPERQRQNTDIRDKSAFMTWSTAFPMEA
ncbi:PREDICTED: uncharacterized protein LOC107348620 isoform X2 [Acropora digitifera]|uniref:uncharacterized protein LOC107348620 isoform X2 n=1 Tax=Acropora digitifera TaxID=70779 RepID=UPI00077A276B|nr:PREDICTED: uncharacterized protein LOC107348620 isoform X2 [Acropora digitifera]